MPVINPDEIASRARAAGSDPIAAVIGVLAGYASFCWEGGTGDALFESERAAAAVDEVVDWLNSHPTAAPARLQPGDRLLVVVAPGHIRTPEDADEFSERLTGFLNGAGQLAVVEGQQAIIVPADYTVPADRARPYPDLEHKNGVS